MSTRRARIKAVTSLPPRRKNADNAEHKVENNEKKNAVSTALQTEPVTIPQEATKHNTHDEASTSQVDSPKLTSSPKTNPTQITVRKDLSPKTSVKSLGSCSVIRSTDASVFLSPQRRDSPRRTFASPFAPSPKLIKSPKITDTHRSGSVIISQTNADFNELLITDKAVTKINHTNQCQKTRKNLIDGQNDSHDDCMDGIVPLQSQGGVPKPIDLLKSEIISENAEVLFDPIVPLPSPSKVRPKLKPAPRLGPHRRNSVQGSASESEDESRRNQAGGGSNTPAPARQRYDSHTSLSTMLSIPNRDVSRVRNDSICSTVSQITTVQPVAASPVKEKQMPKIRRPDVNRRMNASRRRREFVKRDALTMYDLIFYNPTSNPIVPDQDELKAKEENEKDIAEQAKEDAKKNEQDDLPEEDAAPVPQIKLGPNGEIILDEKSLVIKQTGLKGAGVRGAAVREGAWSGGGGRYRRAARSADWTPAETVRFYRALAALGTDFTLMAPLFPGRTRNELKLKFKKEEKLNGAQVDKALRSATGWDVARLGEEFKEEREEAQRRAERERERLLTEQRQERARIRASRNTRVRSSKGSKALETTVLPGLTHKPQKHNMMSADDFIERSIETRPQKKNKPIKLPNSTPKASTKPDYATLTLLNNTNLFSKTPESDMGLTLIKNNAPQKTTPSHSDMAIIAKVNTATAASSQNTTPVPLQSMPQVPSNIETGSLVVLTVNDPTSPGKKMLQTYIAHGPDKLTPVALPTTFLNSVVGYMKKNSLKGSSTGSSPLMSPNSVASQDSRSPSISVFPSPTKRQRHSSYTITHL